MPTIDDQLQQILRRVLRLPDLQVEEGTTVETVPGWDSLAHVEILAEIQREYRIRFRASEIIGLENVGSLQALIHKKAPRAGPPAS